MNKMIPEVINDVLKRLQENKNDEIDKFIILSIQIFLELYSNEIIYKRNDIFSFIELQGIQFLRNVMLDKYRELVEKAYSVNIKTNFRLFQRYISEESFKDTMFGSKMTSLYLNYRRLIVDYERTFNLITRTIIETIMMIFKLQIEAQNANFESKIVILINCLVSLFTTFADTESTYISADELELYERNLSKQIYEFMSNIQIVYETGRVEENFEVIDKLLLSELLTLFRKDFKVHPSLSISLIKTRSIAENTKMITFGLVNIDPSIKKLLMSDYETLMYKLRYYMMDYHVALSRYEIYQKMSLEIIDRDFIPITDNVIFEGRQLTISYDNKIVLEGVDVMFSKGNWVSIVGCSGSGKTTLSNVILGKLKPSVGNITFCDKAYTYHNIYQHISYISTDGNIFEKSIEYNCLYGIHVVTEKDIERMNYYLELFGITLPLSTICTTLSTGQKQRIKIIRLILENRPIWILDEITSHIDNKTSEIIVNELRNLSENRLVIFITHNMDLVNDRDILFKL